MRSFLEIFEHLGLQTRDYLRVVYTAQVREKREVAGVEVGWAVMRMDESWWAARYHKYLQLKRRNPVAKRTKTN